jgi:CRP-like cAMP-binding protein
MSHPGVQGSQAGRRCAFCLSRRAGICAPLPLAELESALGQKSEDRAFPAGAVLYRQGAPQSASCTVHEGWLALAVVTPGGKSAIVDFALPGDFVGFHGEADVPFNHPAACLTPARACVPPTAQLRLAMPQRPEFALRLAQLAACAELRAQDHLVNVGARHAPERIAHLLLALFLRANGSPPSRAGESMAFPLRLSDIGAATALTAVHASRVLKRLRLDGIVALRNRRMTVLDPARLVTAAGLDEPTEVHAPPRQIA